MTKSSPSLSTDRKLAGILVPVFALRGPNDLGIGDTAAVDEFIDWCKAHGLGLLKILPINETGGDHSPYNAISSRALDPTIIHLHPDAVPGLTPDDLKGTAVGSGSESVDYPRVKGVKHALLAKAFERFVAQKGKARKEFEEFISAERAWLEPYSLFRVAMEQHGGSEQWDQWSDDFQSPEAVSSWLQTQNEASALRKRREYFMYVQWVAFSQWRRVKQHAEKAGVLLMGDIPFGVSYYSADVWANRSLFQQGWSGGTPPDKVFKHDPFVQKWGQNWGIPLYNWNEKRAENIAWWRQRVHGVRELFDLFRVDHVLGFYRIYGFPWRPERNGEFLNLSLDEARQRTGGELPHFHPHPDDSREHKDQNCREGEEYLRALLDEAGAGTLIGEDLGEVPDYVRPSLTSLGIAGYKIPAWERNQQGRLIPSGEYQRLSLATFGTHDHEPLRTAWEQFAEQASKPDGQHAQHELQLLREWAGIQGSSTEFSLEVHRAMLRALFGSNSWIAVVMATDLFARRERFNVPGTASGSWTQRLHAPTRELDREPILKDLPAILEEAGRRAK